MVMRGSFSAVHLLLGTLRAASACETWCNQWICKQPACLSCGEAIGCPAKPPPPPFTPPNPQLPPWYQGLAPGEINFVASGGVLYANGHPFFVKGVNWLAPCGIRAQSNSACLQTLPAPRKALGRPDPRTAQCP